MKLTKIIPRSRAQIARDWIEQTIREDGDLSLADCLERGTDFLTRQGFGPDPYEAARREVKRWLYDHLKRQGFAFPKNSEGVRVVAHIASLSLPEAKAYMVRKLKEGPKVDIDRAEREWKLAAYANELTEMEADRMFTEILRLAGLGLGG